MVFLYSSFSATPRYHVLNRIPYREEVILCRDGGGALCVKLTLSPVPYNNCPPHTHTHGILIYVLPYQALAGSYKFLVQDLTVNCLFACSNTHAGTLAVPYGNMDR